MSTSGFFPNFLFFVVISEAKKNMSQWHDGPCLPDTPDLCHSDLSSNTTSSEAFWTILAGTRCPLLSATAAGTVLFSVPMVT